MFGTNMGTYTENSCGVWATVLLSGDHFFGSPYRCYFLGFVGASMLDNFNVTTTPQRVCLFCGYPCFGDLKVKLEGKQQHIVILIYIYICGSGINALDASSFLAAPFGGSAGAWP